MRRTVFQLIAFLLSLSFQTQAQDFWFEWEICPSFSASYTIIIQSELGKGKVTIDNIWDKKTYKGKLNEEDCIEIFNFLSNYNFVNRGSTEYTGKIRNYLETEILADTNWVLVKGDSIRKSSLWGFGYYFDNDSNKYYAELKQYISWTDGTTYKGKFITEKIIKQYSVYSPRITSTDFELNQIIAHIIKKVDRNKELKNLLTQIENDKP